MKPKCFGKNNCVNIRWYKCEQNMACTDKWGEQFQTSNKTGEEK